MCAAYLGLNARQSTAILDCSSSSTERWDQTRLEMQVMPPGSCRPLGCFPVGVSSRTCLVNLSWDILDTWLNQLSWDISIWKSGLMDWHSGFYEFHSCALCGEVSHHELFVKIPALPLAHDIALFDYPRFMTIGEDLNKNQFENWRLSTVWKLPFCDHIARK